MIDKDTKSGGGTGVPSASAEMRSPEEWAKVVGQVRPKGLETTTTTLNGKPFDVIGEYLDMHAAAAMLHGWGMPGEAWGHRHHANEPFKLTRQTYEAALAAAGVTNAAGHYVPHIAALSPHASPQNLALAKGGS